MRKKAVFGLVFTALVGLYLIYGSGDGYAGGADKRVPLDSAILSGAERTSVEKQKSVFSLPTPSAALAAPQLVVNGGVTPATSAPSAIQFLVSSAQSNDGENYSKQQLHRSIDAASGSETSDPPLDRLSPEFNLVMAAKNAEMNAIYRKQAAQNQALAEERAAATLQPAHNRKGL